MALAIKPDHFNLDLLPALGALLNEKSVTRAAELLCISQPAMSGVLQRLRDHFDDPLLVRSGRDMELTPRALALVEPVRELLLRARVLLEEGPQFDPAQSRRGFTIAMSDYAASTLMPRVTRRVLAEAPGASVEVEPLYAPVYERMNAGELDFIVTAEDARLDHSRATAGLLQSTLFSDRFVCVVAKDNPHVGDRLTLATYRSLPHGLVRFGRGMTSIEDDTLQRMAVQVLVATTSSSFTNLLFLVPGSDLICTVQERLALRLAPILSLRILPPPLAIPDLTETLIWHRRSAEDPGHSWLRRLIAEEARALREAVPES